MDRDSHPKSEIRSLAAVGTPGTGRGLQLLLSETFDASDPLLEVSGGTDLITASASWTAPTGKSLFATPLHWSVFGGYTDFISLDRLPLGFNDFFEFGAGLEFRLKRKILGFNLDFVGLEFSALVGEDLRGWTWAITVRS